MSAEELYDALLTRCRIAQREGIDLEYAPLLVLSMLEGVAVDRVPGRRPAGLVD